MELLPGNSMLFNHLCKILIHLSLPLGIALRTRDSMSQKGHLPVSYPTRVCLSLTEWCPWESYWTALSAKFSS